MHQGTIYTALLPTPPTISTKKRNREVEGRGKSDTT
jgi:hypothetical protein